MTTHNTKTITAHSRIGIGSTDKNFTKIITFKSNDEFKQPTSLLFLNSNESQSQSQSQSHTGGRPFHSTQQIPTTPESPITSNTVNTTTRSISKVEELGRKLINRLDSLGLLPKDITCYNDVSDSSFSDTSSINNGLNNGKQSRKRTTNEELNRISNDHDRNNNGKKRNDKRNYNCKINLEMSQGDEEFNVDLYFFYQLKDSHGTTSPIGNSNGDGISNGSSFLELPPNLYVTYEELINYLRDKIFLSGVNKNLHGIETKINILLKLKSFRCFINGEEFKQSRNN